MLDISILVDIADYYDISIPGDYQKQKGKSEMMNEEERKLQTMSIMQLEKEILLK